MEYPANSAESPDGAGVSMLRGRNATGPGLKPKMLTVIAIACLVVTAVVAACGQDGQALAGSVFLGGQVRATSNEGQTVTVVSLDRPVRGKLDGLVEYFFVIIKPVDPIPDIAERARLRWAAASQTSAFVEMSLESGAAWLFVAGDHSPEPTSDHSSTSVHRVPVRNIIPLRAAGDGVSGLGTPGNGNRSHEEMAAEWFQRIFDFDGLR